MPQRRRVLVVDDERAYFELIRKTLGSEFDFKHCATTVDGEAALRSWPCDLIMIDLRLSDHPGDTSGFGFLRLCRTVKPRTPAIVMTQYPMSTELIVSCMHSGAYYYFRKQSLVTDPAAIRQLAQEAIAHRPQHDFIEDDYPHQIALLYRDVSRNVVAPQLKLIRSIELFETILKHCAIVCWAEARGAKLIDDRFDDFVASRMHRPSLGTWLEFLVLTLDRLHTLRFSGQIADAFSSHSRSAAGDLVRIRNEVFHGATRAPHEYDELVLVVFPVIREMLDRMRVLGLWKWFAVAATRQLTADLFEHDVISVSGHNPRFLIKPVQLSTTLIAHHVCVSNEAGSDILDLHPWLVLQHCQKCQQLSLFLYDKYAGNRVSYLDYVNGHHMESVDLSRDIHEGLGRRRTK